MKTAWGQLARLLALLVLSAVALQLYFLLRVALMLLIDPQSTSFQRSEAWRLLRETHQLSWSQDWVADDEISPNLKRAVIASEDAGFVDHAGVEWDALEKAWDRNQKAEVRAEKVNERIEQREATRKTAPAKPLTRAVPKVVGGSTISQQLAKNLFLSGERTALRKAQEFVITFMLEGLLGKRRILAIYLNSVEWGEGVFGAEAAARHYFHVGASKLSAPAAARLAVMLPAPKRFEKQPGSAYVIGRSGTIVARMGAVELP
ncbi:MAG TPA: transglycosylase domain-containing protein [Ideonella sp.]|uniref:transglycosylase domain-containing protein n=1 Tax=Ideonella sp. TaxID=1929293 RepID=UPI002BE06E58|nr:transglycosylase domain-containing protein [Ideonella sp.]HSI48337.1 transglycosylase domain-containing protein [Ideonella sp.]